MIVHLLAIAVLNLGNFYSEFTYIGATAPTASVSSMNQTLTNLHFLLHWFPVRFAGGAGIFASLRSFNKASSSSATGLPGPSIACLAFLAALRRATISKRNL